MTHYVPLHIIYFWSQLRWTLYYLLDLHCTFDCQVFIHSFPLLNSPSPSPRFACILQDAAQLSLTYCVSTLIRGWSFPFSLLNSIQSQATDWDSVTCHTGSISLSLDRKWPDLGEKYFGQWLVIVKVEFRAGMKQAGRDSHFPTQPICRTWH